MNGEQAGALVRSFVWGAQKARSISMETLGTDDAANAMLETLEPFLFGENNVLPRLLEWQARIRETNRIEGRDLYNFMYLLELKARSVLMCAAANGYDIPEEPDIAWMTQTWTV